MNQTTQTDETAPSIKLFGRNEVLYQKYLSGSGLSPDSDIARCIATIEHERARADAAEKERDVNDDCLDICLILLARQFGECEKLRSKVAEAAAVLPLLVEIAAREQRYACVDYHFMNYRAVEDVGSSAIQNAPAPDFETVLAAAQKWMAESNEVSDD